MSELKESNLSEICIVPNDFGEENALSCHLSVELGQEHVAASVLHIPSGEYIAVIFSREKLEKASELYFFLGLEYKSTSITYPGTKATLVPFPFFKKEKLKDICELNFQVLENETCLYNQINNLNTINCFTLNSELKQTIDESFENYSVLHNSTSILEYLQIENKNSSVSKVFASLADNQLHLIWFEGNKLQFSNMYSIETKEDVTYFVVNLFDSNNLNANDVELKLLGSFPKMNPLKELLEKYILNVSFVEISASIKLSKQLEKLENHKFINVFTQYLCV